jgi:hypothetical protein
MIQKQASKHPNDMQALVPLPLLLFSPVQINENAARLRDQAA